MTSERGYKGTGVLVTGAQGFTGSWLVERLLAEGARVLAPLRPAAAESRFVRERLAERCELVDLDLLDHQSTLRVLNEGEVELVFHLAAQTTAATAIRSPMATFDANARTTYTLLEACRILAGRGPAARVVVASSYCTYGHNPDGAFSEDTAMHPRTPYEVSKACADFVTRCYAATYELPVTVTRTANIYGGGDINWSRIIPGTARALARGERPVITSDGTAERDYIYVEDAVDAYLAVARSLEDPALRGQAWNVGLGRPVSVLELVRALIATSGKDLEPDVRGSGEPGGAVDGRHLDAGAIRGRLGWAPKWDLDRGLAATYGWYEANLDSD